ncbi:MAG: phosphatidylglycerol:prolipoprotein diacylglycerol transferase [Myxococcota bacterium]|jgi:phosphatidylglycerol:prolipoprotein diacylglycerol transferase
MFPTLFTFSQEHGLSAGFEHFGDPGVVGFHSWGLMVMMAFLVAFLTTSARAPKVGIDPDSLVPLYLLASIFGMLGSRLLHFVFAEPALLLSNPLVFFDTTEGGFAFLGGVIGGVLSGGAYALWRGIPLWKLADVIAPTIMFAAAVGRIGCFLSGCCHGAAVPDAEITSTLLALPGGSIVALDAAPFLALIFEPNVGVGAIHNVPVYPTQLWEIVSGLTLFAFLSWMWFYARRFDGQIIAAMIICYAPARIFNEMFRGDSVRGVDQFGTGLSTSQLVSLALVLVGIVIIAVRFSRGISPEEPIVYDDDDEAELDDVI